MTETTATIKTIVTYADTKDVQQINFEFRVQFRNDQDTKDKDFIKKVKAEFAKNMFDHAVIEDARGDFYNVQMFRRVRVIELEI